MITYKEAGVDVAEADKGVAGIVERIKRTWPSTGNPHQVLLDIGYFANVIDIGFGMGAALCMDGVGSKTALCAQANRYEIIGIDCVAMNVNDLICLGATPISMVDYIITPKVDAGILSRIGIGLEIGAKQAGISIIGGEVAQLPLGLDIAGAGFGLVRTDRINTGSEVTPGDIIIGIESNGLHANGFTLLQKIFDGWENWDDAIRLMLEFLKPTHIYVPEILEILKTVPVKALINITGDGLLNLLRINREGIGFVIDKFPRPSTIFEIIQATGDLDNKTMFEVFNMGVGFCIVVAPSEGARVCQILSERNRRCWVIGHTVAHYEKTIFLPEYKLIGRGKSFYVD